MSPTARKFVIGAAFAAVLAGGAGIAAAAGTPGAGSAGDDDEPALSGDTLEKASAAAIEAAGGGTVTNTEGPDEEQVYEVEVTREDGTKVDVDLDASFAVVGTPEVEGQDDTSGTENDTDDSDGD